MDARAEVLLQKNPAFKEAAAKLAAEEKIAMASLISEQPDEASRYRMKMEHIVAEKAKVDSSDVEAKRLVCCNCGTLERAR